MSIPRPGSEEATNIGCRCPVVDNHHGAGYRGGGHGYLYASQCTVHRLGERMDPDAAMQRIIEALHENDFDEVFSAVSDLRGWLGIGGFPPTTNDLSTAALAALTKGMDFPTLLDVIEMVSLHMNESATE